MKEVILDFENRMEELYGFLDMLKAMDRQDASIYSASKASYRAIPVKDEWRKVAKASAFLIAYNVVESAVRSGFSYLYDEISNECLTLNEIASVLRDVWLDTEHRKLSPDSATPLSYRRKAVEMVQAVLDDEAAKFDSTKLRISGNLDARKIRELYEKHGIPCWSHYSAKNGFELLNVKDQRNALAHGLKSFSECGRDYTVDDLIRISRQMEIFIKSVLRNLAKYIQDRRYRTPA